MQRVTEGRDWKVKVGSGHITRIKNQPAESNEGTYAGVRHGENLADSGQNRSGEV